MMLNLRFSRLDFARKFIMVLLFALGAQVAHAQAPLGGLCLKLPAINPDEDFVGNFNNSCYALNLTSSHGADKAGDLNAVYGEAFYKIAPGYELVLLGTFPNARFFSVTVYDEHAAVTANVLDVGLLPLNGSMFNPFLTSAPYEPNQQYGATIGFGGGPVTSVQAGCSTSDTTIDQNFLDASQIHQGITWNGYPDLPKNFPVHQTGANDAGAVIVRSYYDISTESQPVLIVRQLSNGCALPLSKANGIITTLPTGGKWSNSSQISAHEQFSLQIRPVECFPADPINQAYWVRSADYVPGDNGAAGYLYYSFADKQLKSLISGGQFIRMQFQLPTVPNTPCNGGGCGLTGLEQLRYRSISFEGGKETTYASIDDAAMVKDANGNVALILGLGTTPPAYVTAQNGYTYIDLSQVKDYDKISRVAMRDLVPNASFQCSAENVPIYTGEFNPEGGYMGNYVPTVDYPTASEIPPAPVPVNRPNSCTATVTQTPTACGTENIY